MYTNFINLVLFLMYAFPILMTISTNPVILFENILGAWASSQNINYKYSMHISKDLCILHTKSFVFKKWRGYQRGSGVRGETYVQHHLLFWDFCE